ncbi:MAG: hypothetical protein HC898_07520 [Phycisphaerales bacterium]|nr:hypothetical protein [Phycisphaerales bacterium]
MSLVYEQSVKFINMQSEGSAYVLASLSDCPGLLQANDIDIRGIIDKPTNTHLLYSIFVAFDEDDLYPFRDSMELLLVNDSINVKIKDAVRIRLNKMK